MLMVKFYGLCEFPTKAYLNAIVLGSTAKNAVTDFKGKDAKLAKWEEEVRKSIAAKKSATVTMSKQEQALVHEQLEKEAHVRNEMTSLKSNLERGFSFLRGLVAANAPELQIFAFRIVENVLQVVSSQQGFALLGQDAFDAFLVRLLPRSCVQILKIALGTIFMLFSTP
jgi:hypothetical protein